MRPRKKEGKVISINLDVREIELMDFDMGREGFKSRTEYLGWLITSRNYQQNPAEYLKRLERDEQEFQEQIKKIRLKRKEAIRNLDLVKEIDLMKLQKRSEAIKIIERKIIEEGVFVAEQFARNWSRMLNCSYSELLLEASRNVQEQRNKFN